MFLFRKGQRAAGLVGAALIFAFATSASGDFMVVPVATGLNQPTHVAQAPGDNSSIYIMERVTPSESNPNAAMGRIIKHDLATGTQETFFNFSNVGGGIQQDSGLLAMTFHPDFQDNGKFYVTLAATPSPISNQLREYRVVNGSPIFQRTLLQYSGTAIHTIDWVGFNPVATGNARNYLYVTTGDGGPQANSSQFSNRSQYLDNVYGKVLRIDVTDGLDAYPADPNRNYGIPPENPFVGQPGAIGEVLHSGFRNPWRASFDRETGDMYIGDVGFSTWEETNFIKAGTVGQDFGWPTREGMVLNPNLHASVEGPPPGTTMINPILVRHHSTGDRSVNGGFVYRGPIEELQGKYIYSDHIGHRIYSFDFNRNTVPQNFVGNNVTNFTNMTSQINSLIEGGGEVSYITSFAEDNVGNLYIVSMADKTDSQYFSRGEGIIYAVLPVPPPPVPGDFNGDGAVDGADFVIWQTNFPNDSGEATLAMGDANGDGNVDGADFVIWQTNFPTIAGAQTVPEPATGIIAAVGCLGCTLLLRRRK